jgi:hypothetical protein
MLVDCDIHVCTVQYINYNIVIYYAMQLDELECKVIHVNVWLSSTGMYRCMSVIHAVILFVDEQ